ncbi:hypothetical protein ANCCAN_13523 [Ancylostoma caninum]|uniref:Uncharacterized protein n=1 Tax=Ancylostoma caninum TaxID=29170 RepID=A0A368G803_ANCCA|nr:hypothetical protein ANCCAN_13523 [Ancylostoma caninum]
MSKFVLTRISTPPTPLLPQVPRNSSSPVSKVALTGRCLLVSVTPMTLYLIFQHHQILYGSLQFKRACVEGSLDNPSDLVLTISDSSEITLYYCCVELQYIVTPQEIACWALFPRGELG